MIFNNSQSDGTLMQADWMLLTEKAGIALGCMVLGGASGCSRACRPWIDGTVFYPQLISGPSGVMISEINQVIAAGCIAAL